MLSDRLSTPRVYSKRKGAEIAPYAAKYVGRPTIYGNPFVVGAHVTQFDAVAAYEEWIWRPEQAELRERVRRDLRGKDLVCWCHPLPCHADVLLEIANDPAALDETQSTENPDG